MKKLLMVIAVSAAFLLAGCASKPVTDEAKAPVAKKKCADKKVTKKSKKAKYNK